jgi:hypothetical protein
MSGDDAWMIGMMNAGQNVVWSLACADTLKNGGGDVLMMNA